MENESPLVKLLIEFPLRPIQNDEEFADAVAIGQRLANKQNLTPEEEDYGSVLSYICEIYEKNHFDRNARAANDVSNDSSPPDCHKWISVKDQLPDKDDWFFIAIPDVDDGYWYDVATYDTTEKKWLHISNFAQISHWMPLIPVRK